MASRLSWWLGGTALACAIVALAYLPPRGMQRVDRMMRVMFSSPWREPKVTAAQAEAKRLADDLRVVQAQLRATEYRREAERQGQDDASGPMLVVGQDTMWSEKQRAVRTAVDSAWRQLGIEDPKVAVLVATPERLGAAVRKVPGHSPYDMAFVLPDSLDRSTCVAILPVYWRGEVGTPYQQRERTGWFRRALGPCAFYARFGAPSPRVSRWLRSNQFDIGESSDWSTRSSTSYQFDDYRAWAGSPMWMMSLYSMPVNTVACLAGRLPACSAVLREGDVEDGRQFSNVLVPPGDFRPINRRFVLQATLLSSIVRQVGEQEFQQFWTTELPVDSALTLALHQSSAEWVNRWQIGKDTPPRLGAAPPLSAALLATLLAMMAISLAAYAARWRQVR